MSPGVQNAWTPGVDRAKWTPRSISSSVAGGLVPRPGPALGGGGVAGDRVGQRAAVGPGPPRHRLDHHDADVALGADGEELLGGLAVLGPGPQGGVDREHHGVEVEAAQRLEVGLRHLEVVARDAGEAGLAGVAELEDPLERGRAPVELVQRGDGVRLVEVEHLGVEQAPGGVELLGDAVGIGPQRLARDEHLVRGAPPGAGPPPTRPRRTAARCRGGSRRASRASRSHSPASSTVASQQAAPPRTATLLSWPVRPRRRRSIARSPATP